MIWLAFALITAVVALCLVWPLATRTGGVDAGAADVAFYRSQLAELDADVSRGAVSAAEADVTRSEIARRLLATASPAGSARPARGPSRRLRVLASALAVVAVPALALGLYLRVGHPEQPDDPLAARTGSQAIDLASAIPRIEARLAAVPDDARGWSLIAPIYLRLGRYDDAVKAYGQVIRVLGDNADRQVALGQAMVMAADGVVTRDARAVFDKALQAEPKNPEARFYEALAAEQDGDKPRATAMLQALLADAPADAPWRTVVQNKLAGLSGEPIAAPPAAQEGPNSAAGAALAALPAGDQMKAIRGMVDGLAARLAQNGRDRDGWLRLIRAYTVLGDDNKARSAIGDARRALADDTASLARIDALGHELGLEGSKS